MATITGLTADRMLEIEAASVVDGDVVGNDLILAKHDGSIINAGNVRGPAGPVGPMGQALSVVSGIRVAEIGELNQIRAGRQLTPADFTNLGLSAPLGLWNLSNFNDSSGNARHLTNKTVPSPVTLTPGINGLANTAALFRGLDATPANTPILYLPDTGAADPFRIKTGTWGCWFRTARRGTQQVVMGKLSAAAGNYGYEMYVWTTNTLSLGISVTGSAYIPLNGIADVADGRWHFGVCSWDGTFGKLYVDGNLDGQTQFLSSLTIFPAAAPLNIGGRAGDATTTVQLPLHGPVDEAFVTSDILSEEQVRNLYCTSLTHSLGSVPVSVSMSVRRKRRGATLSVSDFPSQPLHLYNFSGGSIADQGSLGTTLIAAGATPPSSVAGADGAKDNAMFFGGVANQHWAAPDTGLPAGLAARSYGAWFKSNNQTTSSDSFVSWGTMGSGETRIRTASGTLASNNGADAITGGFAADGLWHFGIVVETNTPGDLAKRKLYMDARCVATSINMNSIVLAGAGRFRIGAGTDGTIPFVGEIDAVFVCDYALTQEQIRKLYDVSSQQMASTPILAEERIEAFESGRLLAAFDILESCDSIDLAVGA